MLVTMTAHICVFHSALRATWHDVSAVSLFHMLHAAASWPLARLAAAGS